MKSTIEIPDNEIVMFAQVTAQLVREGVIFAATKEGNFFIIKFTGGY